MLDPDTSASHPITEQADQTGLQPPPAANNDTATGTLTFHDLNFGDKHTVAVELSTTAPPAWSGGSAIPGPTLTDVASALTVSILPGDDSTNSGTGTFGDTSTGTVTWNFSLQDKDFDFLAVGETLTLTYNVSVTDDFTTPATSNVETVTVVITGTNDQPVITAGTSADLQEDTGQTGQDTPAIATSGTLAFTDVDLTDTHTVTTQSLVSAVWSTGGTVR